MSISSKVSLGSLRLQAQQRSDLENNSMVSTIEWNQYLSGSYKELYDILISAYGNDYFVAQTYQFPLTGAQQYQLPDGTDSFRDTDGNIAPKFYKLLGVDLQYSASPSGYVSLRRFEFIERNRYAYPNTTVNANGYTNLRYRISDDKLFIMPIPMAGQNCRVWYAPAPTSLQFLVPAATVINTSVLGSMTTTVGITTGMQVVGTGLLANTTVKSVGSTTVTVSSSVTMSQTTQTFAFYNDSTLMEGISGWEDYVILDAAIKAQIKQESDFTPLKQQKDEMRLRIEAMAESRDIGQAQHVSDVQSLNGGDYGGMMGSGYDGWWGY